MVGEKYTSYSQIHFIATIFHATPHPLRRVTDFAYGADSNVEGIEEKTVKRRGKWKEEEKDNYFIRKTRKRRAQEPVKRFPSS
jgi:hypothetical protein